MADDPALSSTGESCPQKGAALGAQRSAQSGQNSAWAR
jgi:hypothetical protein